MKNVFSSLMSSVSSLLRDDAQLGADRPQPSALRMILPAAMSVGLGSGPIPDVEDSSTVPSDNVSRNQLPWDSIYFADEICDHRVLREVVQNHEVLVIKRGGCSFSEKLKNIAAYPPSGTSLKLVIVVSYDDEMAETDIDSNPSKGRPLAAVRAEPYLVRPLLEEVQMTAGIPRPHLISMVMVGGGEETYELLRLASAVGIKRRYTVHTQGVPISNLYIV